MKRIFISTVMLLVPIIGALYAQSVLIEYVEGVVDVRDGDSWLEVRIGDTVAADATLRLGTEGLIELHAAGSTFLLSEAGSYDLGSIIQTAQRNESVGIGSIARRRIRSLVREDSSTDAVVAGIRASEAATRDEVDWAGGESVPELIAMGISSLDEGNLEDAYYVFYDAWEFAGSEELPEAQFYLGYSAYLIGEIAEALRYLRDPAPSPETTYYSDHVLTLAQIQVESFAFTDAITLIETYIDTDSVEDAELQTAQLLAGLAYDGLGDDETARERFQAAYEIDPESENAALATTLIESL